MARRQQSPADAPGETAEPAPEAVSAPTLAEEIAALSREVTAAGLHAEHALVNEVEVLIGALRNKLKAESAHPGVSALFERLRNLL